MEVTIQKDYNGVKLIFGGITDYPIIFERSYGEISSRLKKPIFQTEKAKIGLLFPEIHHDLIKYIFEINQVQEIDNWFNQPVTYFLDELKKGRS